MKRVLITGIAGFVGSHLADRLAGESELWGVHIDDRLENISAHLAGPGRVNLIKCDLTDPEAVAAALREARPDAVVHLAAQSTPSSSFTMPGETLRTNLFSTLNLFEAAIKHAPEALILSIGSGDEYGAVPPEELPVSESALLRPLNPYAVSKAAQDLLGYQYWMSHGLRVIRCRPFNHLGPRQHETLVASSFAKQVAEIEAGVADGATIRVGNLEPSKDFLDVRDVVEAYAVLLERGEPGQAYNISSGKAVKVREILDTLLSFSKVKISVAQDPGRMRKRESATVYGDSSRMRALGWEPRRELRDALQDILEYWRSRTVKA